jgi:hypothetical protein
MHCFQPLLNTKKPGGVEKHTTVAKHRLKITTTLVLISVWLATHKKYKLHEITKMSNFERGLPLEADVVTIDNDQSPPIPALFALVVTSIPFAFLLISLFVLIILVVLPCIIRYYCRELWHLDPPYGHFLMIR